MWPQSGTNLWQYVRQFLPVSHFAFWKGYSMYFADDNSQFGSAPRVSADQSDEAFTKHSWIQARLFKLSRNFLSIRDNCC